MQEGAESLKKKGTIVMHISKVTKNIYSRFFFHLQRLFLIIFEKNRTTLDIKKRQECYVMKRDVRKIKLHRRHLNTWNVIFTYISQYL